MESYRIADTKTSSSCLISKRPRPTIKRQSMPHHLTVNNEQQLMVSSATDESPTNILFQQRRYKVRLPAVPLPAHTYMHESCLSRKKCSIKQIFTYFVGYSKDYLLSSSHKLAIVFKRLILEGWLDLCRYLSICVSLRWCRCFVIS